MRWILKKRVMAIACAMMLVYALLPAWFGARALLDRRCPSWYVLGGDHWSGLYVIGWEMAGREGKPRMPIPPEAMKELMEPERLLEKEDGVRDS